jgi:hypothetical protein
MRGSGKVVSWPFDDVSSASVCANDVHRWGTPAVVFFPSNLQEIAIEKFMS